MNTPTYKITKTIAIRFLGKIFPGADLGSMTRTLTLGDRWVTLTKHLFERKVVVVVESNEPVDFNTIVRFIGLGLAPR